MADLKPFSEECEEHGEVYGARRLVHHRLQVLISRVLNIGSLGLIVFREINSPQSRVKFSPFSPPGSVSRRYGSGSKKNRKKTIFVTVVFRRSVTKITGSGSRSGSVSQRYGSVDPDLYQNVKDPEHYRTTK
jgi:hypothetical protein